MNYRLGSLALCALLAAAEPSVLQASSFEGLSGMLGLAGVGTTISYRHTYPANMVFSNTNMVGLVDFSYSMMIIHPWLMGLGLSYDLNSLKSTEINPYEYAASSSGLASIEIKNHPSFYIQSTYEHTKKLALFAKLGYHSVTSDLDNTRACLIDCGFGHYTNKHHGVGYGVGFISSLQNVFLESELQMVHYGAKTFKDTDDVYINTLRPKTILGVLGIGYRF